MGAVAVGALSLGLVQADDWGWGSARTLLTVVITVVALTLLARRVRTHPAPIMSPRLFRVPSFTVANMTTLIFTSAFGAVFLSVSLWLETAAGYRPLRAGLALVPGPLAVPLFAALTQRWARSVPARFVVSAGLAIFGLGSLLLATQGGAHYATDVATGSAVVNTARQAGYALGVAGLVAILGSQATLHTGGTFQNGWILVTVLVLDRAPDPAAEKSPRRGRVRQR